MKKLLLVLVLFAMVFMVGCLPDWIPGVGPDEPEVPVPVMKAEVDAVLVVEPLAIEVVVDEVVVGVEMVNAYHVAWSIENVGDLFIWQYEMTFNVFYPMLAKDIVMFTVTGDYLEVGEKREGIYKLVSYDTPETVSVECELFSTD